MSFKYSDKILPIQSPKNYYYEGEKPYEDTLYELLAVHMDTLSLNKFKLTKHKRVTFEEMSTPPLQLALINFLLKLTAGKTFLEVGTFIGNTTMHVAKFIGKDANVYTIEKFSEFFEIANKNFKDNNLDSKINSLLGDANEVIKNLPDNFFDFVYVDGDKGNYPEIARLVENKITDNGIIAVDDVFFDGDALNDNPKTEKGYGCKRVLNQYLDDDRFDKFIMPINSGILILKKKL